MVDADEIRSAAFAYYSRLQKVKEHVDRHLEDDISLSKAAGIAGLEGKYFSTFFRQKTGIRFRDWIARRRVERAAQMISKQDSSITRTALAVGFHDLRTFERAFKKWMGTTPRAYKKSVKPR